MANHNLSPYGKIPDAVLKGPLKPIELPNGWYVTGEGCLVPVKDEEIAIEVIAELKKRREEGNGVSTVDTVADEMEHIDYEP